MKDKEDEDEDEEELAVILSIVKADLPGNGNFFGSANLYAVARWEGDTSYCDWKVAMTPTLWLEATTPEWEHQCPMQPKKAFTHSDGANISFEVWQDAYTMFGDNSRIGEASVPAESLLEGVGKGDYAEREFVIWQNEEDTGTIFVRLAVEAAPARSSQRARKLIQGAASASSTSGASSRGLRMAAPRRSVRRSRTPSANSSSGGSDSEAAKPKKGSSRSPRAANSRSPRNAKPVDRQLSSASTCTTFVVDPVFLNRSKQQLLPTPKRDQPASSSDSGNDGVMRSISLRNLVPEGLMRMTTNESAVPVTKISRNNSPSSHSSDSEADDKSPAEKVHNAMRSHWNSNQNLQAMNNSRPQSEKNVDNKPWKVEETPNAERQAREILESVKAGGSRDGSKSPTNKQKQQKQKQATAPKVLIKRLRVTAKKYPRRGNGLVALSKERFFAITKDEQGGRSPSKGNSGNLDDSSINGADLSLSWFDDQATYQRRLRPLGSIPLMSICGSTVDHQQAGFVVTVKSGTDEDMAQAAPRKGPSVRRLLQSRKDTDSEPERLSIIFGSLLAAEEWSAALNELVEQTCRH